MNKLITAFLSADSVCLKICGVTTFQDAQELVKLEVAALGVNFWQHSKRYTPPTHAGWLKELKNKILRVGVFVNPNPKDCLQLIEQDLIDVIQLHGDETPAFVKNFNNFNTPLLKALALTHQNDATIMNEYAVDGILLDAYAPGVYGGTGKAVDWQLANTVIQQHPSIPFILAGGITPENAYDAVMLTKPVALDIASGAELSPGIKDFNKVRALQHAVNQANEALKYKI